MPLADFPGRRSGDARRLTITGQVGGGDPWAELERLTAGWRPCGDGLTDAAAHAVEQGGLDRAVEFIRARLGELRRQREHGAPGAGVEQVERRLRRLHAVLGEPPGFPRDDGHYAPVENGRCCLGDCRLRAAVARCYRDVERPALPPLDSEPESATAKPVEPWEIARARLLGEKEPETRSGAPQAPPGPRVRRHAKRASCDAPGPSAGHRKGEGA